MTPSESQAVYAVKRLREIEAIAVSIKGGMDRMDLYVSVGRIQGLARFSADHLDWAIEKGMSP